MIPGWPYSLVAALEPGRTSWTAVLDAVRLGPADDVAEVTAVQVRQVSTADHRRSVEVATGHPGRVRCRLRPGPAGVPAGGSARGGAGPVAQTGCSGCPRRRGRQGTLGRPAKHGGEFAFTDPDTWPDPVSPRTATSRYGSAAAAWDRLHPRLTRRAAWLEYDGALPVLEGTLIRLDVDHLPGDGDPKPLWLWCSSTGASPSEVDRLWQAFLRRFDLEHTFRFFKQILGWTAPKLRDPDAADRWTWIMIACYTQLRLAREPRRGPTPAVGTARTRRRLTPARVRRGFRNLRAKTTRPAGAPKPGSPAPDAHQDRRTASRPPATTSAKPPNEGITLKARRQRAG